MDLHEPPIYDSHWEGTELAADDTHRFVWIWHGYNIRLLAIPKTEEGHWMYEHGWCYPREPQLVAAAVAAWDPDTQDEPEGWHKRPTIPARRAPRREEAPEYNRPRCVHGPYLDAGCRTVNCPEAIVYQDSAEHP